MRSDPKRLVVPCTVIGRGCSNGAAFRPVLRLVPSRSYAGRQFPMLLPKVTLCAEHAEPMGPLPDHFLDEATWLEVVTLFKEQLRRDPPHRASTRVDYVPISEEELERLASAMTALARRESPIAVPDRALN